MTELTTHIFKQLLVFFCFLSHATVFAAELPVESFANLPYIHSVNLSTDGNRIGFWLNIDGQSAIVTKNKNNGEVKNVLATDNIEFKFNWFRWVNNERLVVSLRFPANRYRRPTIETRMVSVMYDGTDAFNLVKHIKPQMNLQDDIVDWLDNDPEHVLIAIVGERDRLPSPAVYKVNVYDGQKLRIRRPESNVTTWVTDRQHRVRLGIKSFRGASEVVIADNKEKNWFTAWKFSHFSTEEAWPLGFGLDPDTLYIQAYEKGRKAIFKVDITKPEAGKTLLLADSKYDIDGELVYSTSGAVVGVKYSQGGVYHFWDDNYLNLYKGINKQLPDTQNYFIAFSRNERRYILLATSATVPGTYYYGDRDKKILVPIGHRYPLLNGATLSETRNVRYKARDGMEIDAYLTLPKNKVTMNLPTIIFPHGGPMERDDESFDYWTAFFANRGYAVFRMNFRGSTGYGFDFMSAGFQNWGLLMQDDITDGTQWLIDKGIADPQRICIVGASYGGYAALMGVVKTPELFRCAVSFAGIFDLPQFVLSRDSDVARHQIGSSFEQLEKTSPLHNVSGINAPVLLVHGEKDRVVPVLQSREMKNVLDKNSKEFVYLELNDGDHYLSNGNNRLLMFKEMDSFLKKHLVQKFNKP